MRRLLLVPALALALVLSGCSSTTPEVELRAAVRDVTAQANSNSADGVRETVDELIRLLSEQVGRGELGTARAAELRELALAVKASAALLDPAPEPSPSPSPSPLPSPSPSPSPEPSPPPSPSPEPSPEPTEEPEEEESEEPEPIVPSVLTSPASAQGPASPQAEPSASPAG